MKKIIWLLICCFFASCAYSIELQGGVKYSVDSARQYLQEGLPSNVQIPSRYFSFDARSAENVVYTRNKLGEIIGITVQYINEPTKAYIYGPDKVLIYMDYYDKSVNIYPHRGYRYDLRGRLDLTSLTVSKYEKFRFSPDGKLIAHSINCVIYDENGNVIGTSK